MKPVIPDYDWSIFGVRVRSRLFLIMTGAYSGSGSRSRLFLIMTGAYSGSGSNPCIIFLASLVVAGCTTVKEPVEHIALQEYASSVQKAVEHNFFDSVSFKGQGCSLKVTQLPGMQVQDVEVVSGDSSMCDRATEAINDTVNFGEFPAKPKGLPKTIIFDFRP